MTHRTAKTTRCFIVITHRTASTTRCGIHITHRTATLTRCGIQITHRTAIMTRCGIHITHRTAITTRCNICCTYCTTVTTNRYISAFFGCIDKRCNCGWVGCFGYCDTIGCKGVNIIQTCARARCSNCDATDCGNFSWRGCRCMC